MTPIPTISAPPPPTTAASESGGWLGLGAALSIHALLFATCNGNFDHDFDAQQYGRIASELARGEYVLAPHPFSQRFGVTLPASLLFRWFGPNWLTASLWPLVCSLLTIALVHRAVRFSAGQLASDSRPRAGDWIPAANRAAGLAALLLAINLIQVRYASRLLPDVVVSAFMLLAAALLQRGRTSGRGRPALLGFLSALALLGALLAKATVVWAGPFFGGLLLLDLVRGKHRALWGGFLAGTAVSALAFFGTYYALTGDALYRIHGIESIHNTRAGFFDGGLSQYAARLTYLPLLYLLERPGFGLSLLLALPAIVLAARAPRNEASVARYWSAYALVVIGCFWFGTTSLEVYTPLYLSDRFLMPFLAPLAMLGGLSIACVLNAGGRADRSRLELAPLVLGAAISAALLVGEGFKRAFLYVILGVLSALLATGYRSSAAAPLTALLLLAMAIPTADYAFRGDPLETPELIQLERDLMAASFPPEGAPAIVLTDPHSAFVLPFYLTPEARRVTRFASWEDPGAEVRADLRAGERALLYIHQPRLIAVNLNWGQHVPGFAREHFDRWELLSSSTLDDQHFVLLFEVDDPEWVLEQAALPAQ